MSDFSDLLQEAEKITVDIEGTYDGTSELPKVDRSIRQVLEASSDLYTKVVQTGAKDIQANLLLGSKGIDLPRIIQKLENISTKRTFESIEPVDDVNILAQLDNDINNSILSIFDDGFQESMQQIRKNAHEYLKGTWKQEKLKILNSMVGTSGAFLEAGKSSTLYLQRPMPVTPSLGMTEALYAQKLLEYNVSVGKSLKKQNLLESFLQVANELKDSKVKEMWEMLKYMVQLPPFPQVTDTIKARYSSSFINALVTQGKKYLEDRYKTYMSSIVNENLQMAMLGGVPGTYPLVRSFVGVRFQGEYQGLKDDKIDGRPLWPMVYFCIRCGDLNAAVHCLKKRNGKEFQDITTLLEAKANNRDRSDLIKLEENVRFNYRRVVRNETDPFKRIVFAVLGCCDVMDEHSEVARTADDYLWLKLSLVRVDYERDDHIKYQDLQRTILEEYGETYYDAYNQPHLYFQVLMLTGQFEAAIEFLSRIDRYNAHSVHMAIVLNELYILAETKNSAAPILCVDALDIKPSRRLNYARLVMLYVRRFEMTSLNEALHYYFLLRNHVNENGVNLFKLCVSELAIETKAYEIILGTKLPNGFRSKGLIDQFVNYDINIEEISNMIGDCLAQKGSNEEAIGVYDIANNQEEVLNLVCTLLSQVVHYPTNENPLKQRVLTKANILNERYAREGYKATANAVQSFLKLRQAAIFFDQYHAKQFPLALKTLNELNIFPKTNDETEERIKQFKRLSPEVAKIIPDLLLATMNILFSEYQRVKGNEYIPSRYQESNIEKQLSHLREQAKILINYAGLVPYHLPAETSSRLVQLEILMH